MHCKYASAETLNGFMIANLVIFTFTVIVITNTFRQQFKSCHQLRINQNLFPLVSCIFFFIACWKMLEALLFNWRLVLQLSLITGASIYPRGAEALQK
jgi:hypothetical protein